MLNHSASLPMSTSVLKALPGKLDIKRHSPSILYVYLTTVGYVSTVKVCIVDQAVPMHKLATSANPFLKESLASVSEKQQPCMSNGF